MKNIGWLVIIWSLIFLSTNNLNGQAAEPIPKTHIGLLPDLPSTNGTKKALGLAGMVGGIHNDVIVNLQIKVD